MNDPILTVGSLFSGVGGLEKGLEMTGHFKTIWQCEIDKYARKVLKKHWPGIFVYEDITKVYWENVEVPDLICGGFPCTNISIAGKGEGIHGKQSGLFFEMAKVINILRPRYALLENVPMLHRRGMPEVLGRLSEIRYDAQWFNLSAAGVGAPHKRERVFIIAYPNTNSLRLSFREHEEYTNKGRVNAQCNTPKICQEMANSSGKGRTREFCPETDRHSRHISGNDTKILQGSIKRCCGNNGEWWDRDPAERQENFESSLDRMAHGISKELDKDITNNPWPYTPRVIEKGLPNRNDRLRCLGNAVVPQVAQTIGMAILAHEGIIKIPEVPKDIYIEPEESLDEFF